MPDVGDRVEMLSKAGTRQGKVTRVSGALVTVEWDTGGQTTVIPAPGVMSVIGGRRPATKAAPAKKKAAPAKKKAVPAKKKAVPAKKKAVPAKKKAVPAKKTPAKKSPVKKSPVKKKAAPAKKKVAAKKKRR
jgi:hypothetical protein